MLQSYAKDIMRSFISGKRSTHFLKVGGAPFSRNWTTKVVTTEFTATKSEKEEESN